MYRFFRSRNSPSQKVMKYVEARGDTLLAREQVAQAAAAEYDLEVDGWQGAAPDSFEYLGSFTDGDDWSEAGLCEEMDSSGSDAWRVLLKEYERKNQLGATAVTSQLQRMKQPTRLSETQGPLTRYRKMATQYRKETGEPYPVHMEREGLLMCLPPDAEKSLKLNSNLNLNTITPDQLTRAIKYLIEVNRNANHKDFHLADGPKPEDGKEKVEDPSGGRGARRIRRHLEGVQRIKAREMV